MKALLLTACFAVITISVALPADTIATFPPLQYDEISHTVLPGSTPAPPSDAFATDFAQLQGGKLYTKVASQQQAPPMPHPQFGIGSILGAIFNPMGALMGMGEQMLMGAVMGGMMGGAGHAAANGTVESGRAAHVAYYQQFMRYENLADKTVTIYDAKTQKRTQIDVAKQQYRVLTGETQSMPAAQMPGASQGGGTAAIEVTVQRTQGGDATIGGVPATEYDTVMTVNVTNATGSCKAVTTQFQTVQYAAKTLPGPGFSAGTFTQQWLDHPEMLAGEGCTATVHSTASGPEIPANHLVLYSRTLLSMPGMDEQTGQKPPQVWMIMERGDIRPVTPAEATTLFTVPAGFTEQ